MTTFDAETVAGLAREYAEWRLGGCPGYDFAKALKAKTTKAARKVGRSYSELWAAVHAEAYKIIDADPRSKVMAEA